MIEVKVENETQEAFDKAMTIFKKLCNKDGFLRELQDRRYYKKPSEIRHEKKLLIKRGKINENF